jgi:S1-C subfamily serine protease
MSEVLESLSSALAGVVEGVGVQIARVDGRRRLPATGIIWSADGLIVTAHHVVEQDEDIKVGFLNGDTVDATLVGRDPSTDIVVLKANIEDLSPASWTDFEQVRVGNLALALGLPGKNVQATLGIVSALGNGGSGRRLHHHGGHRRGGRHGRRGDGMGMIAPLDQYIRTDVVMYPGFSGGPLVGADGNILGMNTSIVRGMSIAIPSSTIQRVVETLQTHGHVRRGYLGVTSQPVALPAVLKEELDQESGLLIIAVEPDSPADKGGLKLGDTIVGIDGYSVVTMEDLLSLLSADRVEKETSVQIVRGGEVLEITLVIGERP